MAKTHPALQQRAARLPESETSSNSTSQWGTSQTELSWVRPIGTSIIHCTPKLFQTISLSARQRNERLPTRHVPQHVCASTYHRSPVLPGRWSRPIGISTHLPRHDQHNPPDLRQMSFQYLVFLLCPLRGCLMCREPTTSPSCGATVDDAGESVLIFLHGCLIATNLLPTRHATCVKPQS